MKAGFWIALGTLFIAACDAKPLVIAANSARPTLAKLCEQHRTDKCSHHHNYVEIYELLFTPLRDKEARILEIGVLSGASMRLWESYFQSARIFGIDIVDKTQHDSARVKTLIADQGRREDLAKVIAQTGSELDVILDDGGHRMDQQQISFATLFPALKSGGLYIIEDIHTSFPNLYGGYGVEKDGSNSTYAMIDRFVRTQKIHSKYLTSAESDYLTGNIAYCMYFFRATRVHSDFFACRKK